MNQVFDGAPDAAGGTAPSERPRFLSEADCHDIAQRLARYAAGGGYTTVAIASTWRGNVRWARNQISTSGDVRDNHVMVNRDIRGAWETMELINEITDEALVAAVRRAERMVQERAEQPESDYKALRYDLEPVAGVPPLFFEATYQLDAGRRAAAARALAQSAAAAGMLSAGYIEVSAHSVAVISSVGWARYFPWTWAQYSVTVRDPTGTGSGWAGVDWPDWTKIDGPSLSAIALDKCLTSRNPVAVEPGRYTTILEPQAVCDFIAGDFFDRWINETQKKAPFIRLKGQETFDKPGYALVGERVIDARLTIRSDPTDPDLASVPFEVNLYDVDGDLVIPRDVFHPVTWIEHGVLTHPGYDRAYAIRYLGRQTGMSGNGSYRMSVDGALTSREEMIATTKRGLLVTRFDQIQIIDGKSLLCRGYTRDGLWLIEDGQISKAVKNMAMTESILFALNNVEQLGVPQRAFHPPRYDLQERPTPVIVPPMKIKDFSFTALVDAV